MKITDRGYWVSTLYKYQSIVYWAVYSIYFKSITFFSAANPCIKLGGMLDDKKSEVYSLVNAKYLAHTVIVNVHSDLVFEMQKAGLNFPIIIKPDIGFKGFLVRKIDNINELEKVKSYFGERSMLMQEFLAMPREFSIMCYKMKDSDSYGVSSFVEKRLPFIVGDGVNTVKQLIKALKNPFLKKELVLNKMSNDLNKVLKKDELLVVDHVGNYARGSKFVNIHNHIDKELLEAVNNFFCNIEGLNFGRLDIKAESIQAVKNGTFKLLEINGAKAEPIHIYDPAMSIHSIIKAIHFHWTTLFTIVKGNIGQIEQPTTSEGLKSFRSLKKTVSS